MTVAPKKSLIKYIGKRLFIGLMQLVCVIYIGHCVFETVPQDRYKVIEGINNVTHDWLDAAKEKRNRRDMVQLAKNNTPEMPLSESALALPNGKSVESLR